MKPVVLGLCTLGLVIAPSRMWSQVVAGTVSDHWNEGAANCETVRHAPLEVHAYNDRTFIIRESLCATFEAPFVYLLVGSTRSLLIDDGAVPDPKAMPLADTVMRLVARAGPSNLRLLVVHTHRHLDHRAGDSQFARLPSVQVVGWDIESVRTYFRFSDWPHGLAQIDLGDRIVDVIPTPGHNETHLAFYDRTTALFFSGDFLMPARLLIDDADAELASARRVAAFVKDRPVAHVLGGHIELDVAGATFPWESQYHPREHTLQMTREDLLALPDAVRKFNGFYTKTDGFILMNSMHVIEAWAAIGGIGLFALATALTLGVRRRRSGGIVSARAAAPR